MVLDGVVPPTFAERDARLWQSGRLRFEVDAVTGQRVSVDCDGHPAREQREIARWPALASPWLSAVQRQAQQLPVLAADCPDDGRQSRGVLHIDGLNDQSTLARPPGATHGPRLQLRALGSDATVQWLLDGRWIAQTQGARVFMHDFEDAGEHTLTALSDDGSWARVRFRVVH
jgi:penicillin-binding protein 1C